MSVVFDTLPTNIAEFRTLAEGKLTNPEYTCALFLCALDIFAKNKEDGIAAINILKGPQPLSPSEISWFKDRMMDKPYLAKVYFEGATPENNYTPTVPYTVNFYPDPRPQDVSPGYMELLVKGAGFDAPRFFKLRAKGDCYYFWEAPSIMMGVRTPVAQDPWA